MSARVSLNLKLVGVVLIFLYNEDNHISEEERAGCLTCWRVRDFVLCLFFTSSWSVICDCGIFWPYSQFLKCM